ncbi:Serine/threonine-protein kinase PknD [compost metagenome]
MPNDEWGTPRPGRERSWHARPAWLILLSLLVVLVTACPRPLVPPMGATGGTDVPTGTDAVLAEGQADFGSRSIQATITDDVAPGATVSLIDVATGRTVSTTYTDPDGRFILKYSNGFKPVNGALYYFEAVKGLKGGADTPNAVGADAIRVRTIASYRRGGWLTLTNSGASSQIIINPMTTALSVVVSLRHGTAKAIDAATLFGAIRRGQGQGEFPDALTLPDTALVPVALVQETYRLVIDALAKERDPVRWITLDSQNLDQVRLPDVPFSIKYLSPGIQEIGKELDLVGVNFAGTPAENQVSFWSDAGWIPATVLSVLPDLTRLRVVVPQGAINGAIRLQIGDKFLTSDTPFQLAVVDGHSVVRSEGGQSYLYAANATLGTIARISPTGESAPYIQGLTSPQALTFGPDGALYVACGGAKQRVVRIAFDSDLKPLPPTDYSGAIPNPSGIAFDLVNGNPKLAALYVSDRTAHRLYRIEPPASLEAAVLPQLTAALAPTGFPLNGPRGLSFGADGRLYVANSLGNNVLAVDLSTQSTSEFVSGLGLPWSVAFDSKGNFYVSSNTGNSIFRRDAMTNVLSAFASVPSPGGLDADASGYIYCADNTSNQIYLVNSLGETRMLATGISSPMGIHVDADGLFVLTGSGQLLKITHGAGGLSVLADGLTGAEDLGRDSSGNFYAYQKSLNRISKITASGIVSPFLNLSNTSDIYVKGTKIYLKKTNTRLPDDSDWSGFAGVEVRDVSNPAVVEKTYRSYLADAGGMAFDTSSLTYENWLYVTNITEGTVVRLKPGAGGGLTTHQAFRFLDKTNAPELSRPWDVWVDPANGNVWVSDQGADASKDGLYVYNSAGTRIKDYSGIVDRPLKFGFDGTRLYLANYGGNQVLQIDRNNGTVLKTFNVTKPRAIAFDGTTRMYVSTWDGVSSTGRWIYSIDDYQGAGAPVQYFDLLAYDMLFKNGNLYALGGSSNKIAADRSRSDRFKSSRGTLYDYAVRKDGQAFHITRDGRLAKWDTDWDGEISALIEYAGGGPVVVDGNGNWLSTFMTGCSVKDLMFGKLDPATPAEDFQQTPIRYGTDDCWVPEANMASDGGSLVFIVANPKGELIRYNTATQAFHRLGKRYGITDRSLGVSVYGGKVYQTIMSKHQIDVYDATATANAYLQTLPVGLVSPEL